GIAWTNPVRGHHEEQVGRSNGTDILQEGTRPDGTKTGWTFTKVTPDSFHWRGEALYPDKNDWELEAELLARRRVETAWLRHVDLAHIGPLDHHRDHTLRSVEHVRRLAFHVQLDF